MLYSKAIKPLLFRMDPERAHHLAMNMGSFINDHPLLQGLLRQMYSYQSSRLTQTLWGMNFANPIGLAAGFDKNGYISRTIQALGFGFVEVGSITAQPSTGNPLPRLFRLPDDRSVINRMGLNNDGAQTIVRRLANQAEYLHIPLGINVAKTHNPDILGDQALKDYVASYKEALKVADYVTVNISCPNTGEGKTFEDPTALRELLDALDIPSGTGTTPTLIKLSADLDNGKLEKLVEISEECRIDGYVATNTSTSRSSLLTPSNTLRDIGSGGLSGSAIAKRSTRLISQLRKLIGGNKTIIGVGGIDSFETALEKLQAGANLLQIYTGMIYEGPGLAGAINKKLDQYLRERGLSGIQQLQNGSGNK